MKITLVTLFIHSCVMLAGWNPAPGISIGSVLHDPSTTITSVPFTLESSSFVMLGLLDTSGRTVSLITDGFSQAGNHRAVLDTDDFPAGIYVLRLDAIGQSVSKICVVLKE